MESSLPSPATFAVQDSGPFHQSSPLKADQDSDLRGDSAFGEDVSPSPIYVEAVTVGGLTTD